MRVSGAFAYSLFVQCTNRLANEPGNNVFLLLLVCNLLEGNGQKKLVERACSRLLTESGVARDNFVVFPLEVLFRSCQANQLVARLIGAVGCVLLLVFLSLPTC